MTAGKLTQITGRGYTDSAPEKDGAGIGVPFAKGAHRLNPVLCGFFVRKVSPMVGLYRVSSDTPFPFARYANLYSSATPDWRRGKQVPITCKRRNNMSRSIATNVAPVIDIPFLKIPQFPAAITSEQIDTIEKVLKEHNRTRRLMLLFLSFDSETFMEKAKAIIDGDEDIYMEAIEALDDYQKKLKSLSELANSALARFLWVGEYVSRKGA